MANIGIIGAGSWGLAIAILLNNNGHSVTVYSSKKDKIQQLDSNRKHELFLPGIKIPSDIQFTTEIEEAIINKDLISITVASPYIRSTSQKMAPYVSKGQIIVNVSKGIEETSLLTLYQVIEQEIPQATVTVLSGPSHAEEVGKGIPTSCVIGARKKSDAEYIQNIFMSDVFRVYTSPDILGISLGGSLKNVIALAAGIADGLGYGDNTKAALVTRGIAEVARLGLAMGGKLQTFSGLSGIGDLIVTCESMHSRNRRAGILLGKGYTAEEAMNEVQMVVEGVYCAKAAALLAKKYNVNMPIVDQVNAILFHNKKASDAVNELMLRDKTIESSDLPWEE